MLLQRKNKRCMQIKDIVRSYAELKNRLKTMEGIFKVKDSEIN